MDKFNVIFDIDGVIVDSEQLHFDVLCELAPDHTRDIQPQQLIGLSLAETLNEIGVPLPEQQGITDRIISVYQEKLSAHYLRPGVTRLIAALQQNDIAFGFVSTAPRAVCLANLGLLDLFDEPALISGDDVERTKPFPDPYLAMLKLKRMDVQQTLVIEDTDLGIAAAKQAGIPWVYAWPHDLSVAEQYGQATCIIGELTDIPQFSGINSLSA
ncbi:HAD family hydrolase [Xenorhabdus bovienii]|uniref:HAD family hydrolase n=1 Tax=Xenorhabdus bovienii TaxID=40576 RepID=UPI0023B2D4F4|nr:HAD family phosphatase [Xenorhabdus bovienii]MDE9430299.1 HAD family phosphatase [Xenorhabdus bovienii]MDE9433859.1 HAD family phosphatase [Xenorhabdus bovienii]MDE9459403.1 HAD family phosphatase [Xenorhabdus bovienii]MDE9462990.1 HAD family phosphatase [Xenorhabdus bovienii]MDE9466935.1 HAD family phosphatase [Xenorhabdus bovienii]